jgi:hypothetical protein
MKGGGLSASAGSRKSEYGGESVLSLSRDKETTGDAAGDVAVTMMIEKNRNRRTRKKIKLLFNGALQRFLEAATMIENRPILTLADLEAFDPRAPAACEGEFLLSAPSFARGSAWTAPTDALSVNVESGAWHCWRCQGAANCRSGGSSRASGSVHATACTSSVRC